MWRRPSPPTSVDRTGGDAAEHPPWCTRNHEPGDPAHASSVHTIQHGSSTIDVSLRDYCLDAGIVVSVDIATEVDSLVLDLSTREAIGLYGAFGDLLDAARSA